MCVIRLARARYRTMTEALAIKAVPALPSNAGGSGRTKFSMRIRSMQNVDGADARDVDDEALVDADVVPSPTEVAASR